jgi:hypothetical protein
MYYCEVGILPFSCPSSSSIQLPYWALGLLLLTSLAAFRGTIYHESIIFFQFWDSPCMRSTHVVYTLTFVMSLLLLYPQALGNECTQLNLPPRCHIFLPYIIDFDIKIIHQRVPTTRSHTSSCHQCQYCCYRNVDFVFIHNVTC